VIEMISAAEQAVEIADSMKELAAELCIAREKSS
jgi:hypothetical protein